MLPRLPSACGLCLRVTTVTLAALALLPTLSGRPGGLPAPPAHPPALGHGSRSAPRPAAAAQRGGAGGARACRAAGACWERASLLDAQCKLCKVCKVCTLTHCVECFAGISLPRPSASRCLHPTIRSPATHPPPQLRSLSLRRVDPHHLYHIEMVQASGQGLAARSLSVERPRSMAPDHPEMPL